MSVLGWLIDVLVFPFSRMFACRACGADAGAHLPDCPRLWRNGGQLTGSGDNWYKEHGWMREEARQGHQ